MSEISLKHTINRINSNEIDSVYSLFGNEAFLQSFFINYISSKFLDEQQTVTYINLDDDKESVLLSELSSYSLFNDKKIIVARRVRKLSKNGKKELFDYIQSPNDNYCLILISETYDFKSPLQKDLQKKTTFIDVRVPFENKIKEWVVFYIKSKKYNISIEVVNDLVDKYGDSISHVVNEIENLYLFGIDKDGYFQQSDKTYFLWQLQDAIGKKEVYKSLNIAKSLLDNGISVVQIISNLSNLFSQLLYKTDNKGTFKYTGLNKIITKKLSYYGRKYSFSEIKNAMLVLRNYDVIYKSSSIKDSIILDMIVIKICKGIY
tara:strand:- start:198 stop:1154 length:957 start_codon:yes stop_codon:yes gene_type:complete